MKIADEDDELRRACFELARTRIKLGAPVDVSVLSSAPSGRLRLGDVPAVDERLE
jgi:hypothetical protein